MKCINRIDETFAFSKTVQALVFTGSLAWLAGLFSGCSSTAQAAPPPNAGNVPAAQMAAKVDPRPIDPAAVASATGGKPEQADKVVKVSFPRNDVAVTVDSWSNIPPFMGLTSWAGFTPGE